MMFTAPVTSRDPSVPTEVSEDVTMEEPSVVPLRTVVPFKHITLYQKQGSMCSEEVHESVASIQLKV